jgi:hypothetical protein
MGAGVAKAIADRYPWIAEKIKKSRDYEVIFYGNGTGGLTIGGVYEYAKRHAPYRILNLITQQGYGRDKKRYVSYDAVDLAFKAVKTIIKKSPISIPKIGAGLGGGSWPIIEAIINEHLGDCLVTIWELPK